MIQVDHTYFETLTQRELEVLQLLANGLSNKEIAEALVIEVSTVKWYNNQIYDKLQVRNRQLAIARARALGLLAVDSDDPIQHPHHNLPTDPLPFIGRVYEIEDLVQQLIDENMRLITILGPGGMGKSRLAIEVGWRLRGSFRDGVFFVPLAAVTSPEDIMTTIAEVIGFRFHGDVLPKQQLLAQLQQHHTLLIVDNFEHLLDHGALLADILHATQHVKMLVTSREKLNLAGETVYAVAGLSTPQTGDTEKLSEYDAVNLFIEVAQRAGQPVPDSEIMAVGRICHSLGGMPLGTLLAASWMDTLSAADIEAEVSHGLGFLETSLRDIPARHHSIQVVFDSSWKRLEAQAQAVFLRLTVFRDGFTREAAQAVTGASIHNLQRLVHTSFIQYLPSGRYAIHELLRQYGEGKLAALGELQGACEQHALFFAEFIRPLGEASFGMFTHEMLEAVNNDYENLRAAWLFQAECRNIAQLRRFMDGLCMFFDSYNRNQEGIDLFEPLLSVFVVESDETTLFRGQLMARLFWYYSEMGLNQKALELAEQSLKILQAFDAAEDLLLLYFALVQVTERVNKTEESINYTEKFYALAQTKPDSKWYGLACLWKYMLDGEESQHEESLRRIEALPDNTWQTFFRAILHLISGDYAQAEALLLQGLKTYWLSPIHYMLWYKFLIECACLAGDDERAWRYVQRGLHYGDSGYYAWATFSLLSAVIPLFMAENHYTAAAELVSLMSQHPSVSESNRIEVSSYKDTLAAHLSADEFAATWARGQRLDLADVISEYMER